MKLRQRALLPRTVAHVTTVHVPDDTRILERECHTLAEAGYDVILVARGPAISNARVRHVEIPIPRSRIGRASIGAIRALRAVLRTRAATAHLHDPELLPIGVVLRCLGRSVIYDAHEDGSKQGLHRTWVPRILRKEATGAFDVAERYLTRIACSDVVAATPEIALRFGNRTTIVANYPDHSHVVHREGPPQPIAVYVGRISVARGVFELVHAVHELRDIQCRLVLAGEFSPSDIAGDLAMLPGWDRVDCLGHIGREEVWRLLASASVGLATLHPTESYLESRPTKVFEYLAAGLPVVLSDFPYWRSLLGQSTAIQYVDPLQPGEIASAIREVAQRPSMIERGSRELAAFQLADQFQWETEAEQLVGLYEKVTGGLH